VIEMIEQLSVFLENRPGRMAEMARVLGRAGNNMRAFVVADTAEYGVARVIVDRPGSAKQALEDAGFSVSITRVIAVEVPDRPGGLAAVLDALEEAGVNVEYAYCFVEPDGEVAVDIFRVEDTTTACDALTAAGIGVAAADRIYEPDPAGG
jgi:hypothetical protein